MSGIRRVYLSKVDFVFQPPFCTFRPGLVNALAQRMTRFVLPSLTLLPCSKFCAPFHPNICRESTLAPVLATIDLCQTTRWKTVKFISTWNKFDVKNLSSLHLCFKNGRKYKQDNSTCWHLNMPLNSMTHSRVKSC